MVTIRGWKTAIVFCLFLTITLSVFYPTLKTFFLADDFVLVRLVRDNGPFGIWSYRNGWFRPLISLTVYVDYQLWGLNPAGYHFTNLLFHAANATLLYLLFLHLLGIVRDTTFKSEIVSFLGAALFLVLPSHSEAVAWISGRTDLIATFFAFLCLHYYLTHERFGRVSDQIFCLLALILAVCSKESSLTIPLVIITYELLQWAKSHFARKRLVKSVTLMLALGCIMVVYRAVRYWSLGTFVGGYGTRVHLHFDVTQMTQNFLLYWYRVFVPPLWYFGVQPNLQPSDAEFWSLRTTVAWISLFSVLCVAIWIGWLYQIKRLQKEHLLICSWLCLSFGLVQIPSINIGIDITNSMGERFIYLSSGFALLLLGILFLQSLQRKVMRIGILTLLIGLASFLTWRASENWYIAGDIARNIVTTAPYLSNSEQMQVFGLPDNLNGAYIFRSGFDHALILWNHVTHKEQVTQLPVKMSLVMKDDSITFSPAEKASNSMEYAGSLVGEVRFFSAQTGFLADNVEVTDLQKQSIGIRVHTIEETPQIYFYSAGALHQLQP